MLLLRRNALIWQVLALLLLLWLLLLLRRLRLLLLLRSDIWVAHSVGALLGRAEPVLALECHPRLVWVPQVRRRGPH